MKRSVMQKNSVGTLASPTEVSQVPEYVRANLHKMLDEFLDSFRKAVEMTTVQQIAANLEGTIKEQGSKSFAMPVPKALAPVREVSKGRRLHGIYIGRLHGRSEAERKQAKAIRANDGVEKAIAWLEKHKK